MPSSTADSVGGKGLGRATDRSPASMRPQAPQSDIRVAVEKVAKGPNGPWFLGYNAVNTLCRPFFGVTSWRAWRKQPMNETFSRMHEQLRRAVVWALWVTLATYGLAS